MFGEREGDDGYERVGGGNRQRGLTYTRLTSMYSVFVTRERNVSVREGRVAGERERCKETEREREREGEGEEERHG